MKAGLLAFALLATPALATDKYVSVENATYHQLVFANDDVAILNNLYPPHSDSGFHEHPRELFYVTVAAARASTQKPDQPIVTPKQMSPTGSVGFNVMTSEPFVHRVVNTDDKPYHVIAIELRRPAPTGNPLTDRAGRGYTQIFDNARLRAWRIILKPGEATRPIEQLSSGVRVVVRGGLMATSRPNLPDQTLALTAGDFSYQPVAQARSYTSALEQGYFTTSMPTAARTLRNIGKTTIEMVELELK